MPDEDIKRHKNIGSNRPIVVAMWARLANGYNEQLGILPLMGYLNLPHILRMLRIHMPMHLFRHSHLYTTHTCASTYVD